MVPLIQSMLATGYHLAKAYNGVWQPCWVAQPKVEQPADKECYNFSHLKVSDRVVECLHTYEHAQQVCRIVVA